MKNLSPKQAEYLKANHPHLMSRFSGLNDADTDDKTGSENSPRGTIAGSRPKSPPKSTNRQPLIAGANGKTLPISPT